MSRIRRTAGLRRGRSTALAVMAWAALTGLPSTAAAQAGWSASPAPIPGSTPTLGVRLAADASGNLIAVWAQFSPSAIGIGIRAARFDRAASAWGPITTLWSRIGPLYVIPEVLVSGPDLVVDAAGNAVAVWGERCCAFNNITARTHAAGYSAATGAWTSIMTTGGLSGPPLVAGNAAGDAVIVWTLDTVGSMGITPRVEAVRAMRYSSAAGAWTAMETLVSGLDPQPRPRDVAMDGAGNVLVVWHGASTVQSTRFDAATTTWGDAVDLSAPLNDLTVSTPPPQVEMNEAGDAVVTWGQDDAVMAARFQPVDGDWTSPATVASGVGVGSTHPAIDPTGNIVLAWAVHTAGSGNLSAARYARDEGSWSSATVVATAPWAVSGVRLAVDAHGNAFAAWRWNDAANPTRVGASRYAVGTAAWTPPVLSPAGLALSVSGLSVDAFGNAVVAWRNADSMAAFAQWTAPPHLLGSAAGDRLALSWTNLPTGAPINGVRIDVIGALGTSVVVPRSESFSFAQVPPGTYTFTVSPLTGTTAGAASNPVTLTFPGACSGPPNPPAAFAASTQGGRVHLAWLPPATGEAVANYAVVVTGAFNGSLPTTARTLSLTAPPGTYQVNVVSVGTCGTSAATPARTLVVP